MATRLQDRRFSISAPASLTTPTVMQATRWHFFVLCFFVLSQAFTIPLIPVGPWATWLGLPDFAMALWLPVLLCCGFPPQVASPANQSLFRMWIGLLFLCLLSFLFFRLMIALTPGKGLTGDSGFVFGIFQLYRLAQFFFSFWMVMHIPLNQQRLKILERLAILVLIAVCAGVFTTYSRILPTTTFVSHLPSDIDISGPWNIYFTYTKYNLGGPFGTVGYNHAYIAAHILLLVIFITHLRAARLSLLDVSLLILALGTVFISESRAGLVSILFYAGIFFVRQPRFIYSVVVLGLLMLVLIFAGIFENPLDNIISEETIERSQTLLSATDASNLSDRDIIWQQRLELLNQNLSHWIVGFGFGNAVNSGSNAHMLALHLILETGIIGLVVVIIMVRRLLGLLWQFDVGFRPVFWGTLALLLASITQETFYPIPSMGYFLGFYLIVIAITLRQQGNNASPS